jgi:hypothetical protein
MSFFGALPQNWGRSPPTLVQELEHAANVLEGLGGQDSARMRRVASLLRRAATELREKADVDVSR